MPDNGLALFVEVILPLPLPNVYTYRVQTELMDEIAIGKRVIVQFGARKFYTAIVCKLSETPPAGYEAKYITAILDDTPLISENQLKFWRWMASYYMCAIGDVMAAAIPAPFRIESETVIKLNPNCDVDAIDLSDKEFLITEALTLVSQLSITEITKILDSKNVFGVLKSLYKKDVIIYSEDISEKYKPKTITCYRLADNYKSEAELHKLFDKLEKKQKQLDVLMAYVQLSYKHEHISKALLLNFASISESSITTLVKNGILIEYKQKVDRLVSETAIIENFLLNDFQQKAYLEIKEQFVEKNVVLLHGITASGKTHVYVKLIEEQLLLNKQVLLLLPEIALTSHIVKRIKKYFGEKALEFHSKIGSNERVEVWKRIKEGKPIVLIGARSAVFMPFENLGLVIVDEEHETTYKQQDPAPRYHARDSAIYLAQLWNAKTLLGSATPSFESYYNCIDSRYGLVEMNTRYSEVQPPKIITANLAEDMRTKSMHGHFTKLLYEKIAKALANKQQVILFQNRRGYAPIMECEQCGWTPKCVNCDINLTYHRYNDSLKCHCCGYAIKSPTQCVACSSYKVALKGFGTEKIEDDLQILFPDARLLRLDLDTTRTKHGHAEIIYSFEKHEADILVGTQMLSKGLDFGNVTLVGVINADQLLSFPDFRSHERAYQLISQVSGRAGRNKIQGEVVVQTKQPEHHVIQEVIKQQYQRLYANEIADRERFLYPPFTRLIKLIVKHKDYKTCEEAAFALQRFLYTRFGQNIIGPESPYISRIKNFYIKEMLIKIKRTSPHLNILKQFIQTGILEINTNKKFKSVFIYADVDPY